MMRQSGPAFMSWPWLAGVRNGSRKQMPRSPRLIESYADTAAYQIAEVYA